MAWSRLQSVATAATASAGTSVSATFTTANLSAGSSVIAVFAAAASTSSNPTTPTCTCGGTSMLLIDQVTASSGTGSTVLVARFFLNTPAGQVGTKPTVTGGWTNSATASILVREFAGLATGSTLAAVVDGGATATKAQNSTGVTPATCNAYSSTASNEMVDAVYGDDGGPATLGALSTGYSADANNVSANSHADIGAGTKNSSSGAETMSWALSGTEPAWGTLLCAFKLAAGSTANITAAATVRATPAQPGAAAPGGAAAVTASSVQGPQFPSRPLGIKIELLINGTWTDITGKLRIRDGIQSAIVITTGRGDETVTMQPSSCTMTLNNRDSSFSPYDPSGPYYPFITRNTQIRVSVSALSAQGIVYSGYRFWGEVPAWPPSWIPGNADRSVVITAAGIMQRINQNTRNIGSALYRYWTKLTGAAAPVAYWPCEDASGAAHFASAVSGGTAMTWTGTPSLSSDTSIAGSDPLPQLNGSSWIGAVSGVATPSPAVYTSPGVHLWTCPGDVTSLTSAEAWGSGSGAAGGSANFGFLGGGGGAYAKITSVAVTPGTAYPLTVAAGGNGTNDLSQSGNGATSSAAFDSASVAAVGGTAPVGNTVGQGGSAAASTGTTKHSGGNGGTASQAGGAGGGGSGGSAANGNTGGNSSSNTGGSGGSAVTGGGKGGNGGNISMPGQSGSVPGGGAGGAGGGGTGTAYPGGNGGAGQIKLVYTSTGAPAWNVLTFCIDVPSTGGTNAAILGEMTTSGTITTVDVTYGTGGTLTVTGYNVSHVSKFTHTSGNICNGVPMAVQVSLTQSGTAVAWSFSYIKPGDLVFTSISSGSVASSTVGGVIEFDANVGRTEVTATGLGQVAIQYAPTPSAADLGAALAAYNGEHAADRLSRLCTEENISFELTGNDFDSAQMGPQADGTLAALLQECEDADRGQIFESQDAFGLGYRTRVSMQNQTPGVVIDYSNLGETIPQPVDDEMLTRNDITIDRPGGSSYEAMLLTGALSVLDPPNGVSFYSWSQTLNLFADSQLQNCATWILDLGTVDDFRWPVIEADLTSARNADANFAALPALMVGDLLEVTNPPSFVQAVAVKQLVWGRTETLNTRMWLFDFNCVPELPYEGGGLPTW